MGHWVPVSAPDFILIFAGSLRSSGSWWKNRKRWARMTVSFSGPPPLQSRISGGSAVLCPWLKQHWQPSQRCSDSSAQIAVLPRPLPLSSRSSLHLLSSGQWVSRGYLAFKPSHSPHGAHEGDLSVSPSSGDLRVMYWRTASAPISSDVHGGTLHGGFWWVITGRAALPVKEANQLQSVYAVKGHRCDKPGHGVACLLCHPSARGPLLLSMAAWRSWMEVRLCFGLWFYMPWLVWWLPKCVIMIIRLRLDYDSRP